MKSTDEIRELGKKEVSYSRQLAVCGKDAANNVLYFWMKGYEYSESAKNSLIDLEKERFEWSLKTFPEATAISSLEKLRDEMEEVAHELNHGHPGEGLAEEYADCLMCLFDSAGRAGLSPETLTEAFSAKLQKNKNRKWVKNPNNTYSHIKE